MLMCISINRKINFDCVGYLPISSQDTTNLKSFNSTLNYRTKGVN